MSKKIELEVDGVKYTVSPLNLRQLEELDEDIAVMNATNVNGVASKEQLASITKIIHASLSRSNKEIELDTVREIVDLGNMKDFIFAVLGASGMEKSGELGNVPAVS